MSRDLVVYVMSCDLYGIFLRYTWCSIDHSMNYNILKSASKSL